MNNMHHKRNQGGMALIEALISILILSLGIFGLMGIQARAIIDTRITNNRAIAIQQINDLNERIWLNREQALAGAYNIDTFAAPGAAPESCDATGNANRSEELIGADSAAACDTWLWRTSLAGSIAGAQTQVQRIPGTNQIRILVAWPLNEKDNAGLDESLQATATEDGETICPDGFICHLQFLEM